MPLDRKFIYWGDSLARVADPLSALLGGESAAVNAIADRYSDLVRRERPTLTLDEWECVCDACNGTWTMGLADRGIPSRVLIDDETAERHEVDASALNGVLAGLSVGGWLAVLHVVERAWANAGAASRATIQEALRD